MLQQRKYYIDVLRIIAILSVILMHCTGLYDKTVIPNDVGWILSIIFGSVTRYAVPIFIMISGSVILPKDNLSIEIIYKKYILRFIISYLFWSFLYTFFFSFVYYYDCSITMISIKNLISGTIQGGYFHLWFMPLIIGLYAIIPLLKIILKSIDEHIICYWITLSVIICFFIPIAQLHPTINGLISEHISTFSVGFFSPYLLYFIMGYFLSKTELSSKTCHIIYILGIMSVLFTILIVLLPSIKTNTLCDTLRQNNTPNVLMMSIALYVFLKRSLSNWKPRFPGFLKILSENSFGVYFVHEIILVKVDSLIDDNIVIIWKTPILFIVTTIFSFSIIGVIRLIKPIAKYIT